MRRKEEEFNPPLLLPVVCLSWDISSSPASGVGLQLLAPGSQTFRLSYIISFPEFPACRKQTVGLLSLHNHATQFVIINLLLYI